jgi:hypothetical protein
MTSFNVMRFWAYPTTYLINHTATGGKVLHRDISVGNIIITGKLEPGGRGVLIDYDNAILLGEKYTPLLDDALSVCKF